jgi:hypothetical protein
VPRTKPYTERGLARVSCSLCERRASHQWRFKACAVPELGYKYYPLCDEHDLDLNETFVRYFFGRGYDYKLREYREKMGR